MLCRGLVRVRAVLRDDIASASDVRREEEQHDGRQEPKNNGEDEEAEGREARSAKGAPEEVALRQDHSLTSNAPPA